jgi:hypothetical protein
MEETKMSDVISEVKNSSEEELREVIEKWLENTRTSGMKVGATFIAAAVYGAIEKNLKRGTKPSLRDYQRAIKRIVEIVSVQLTQQNDLEEATEEDTNDGTTE